MRFLFPFLTAEARYSSFHSLVIHLAESHRLPYYRAHATLGMLAVSTSNPEPLNAFAELYDRTSPEKLYHDKPHMDPHVLRFYVLVHDLSAGPAEE